MVLAAALPAPLIAAAPSKVSFSNPAASVLLTVDRTRSTPAESCSTIGSGIDHEGIVSGAADQRIVAEPAVEKVVAEPAIEDVGGGVAGDRCC